MSEEHTVPCGVCGKPVPGPDHTDACQVQWMANLQSVMNGHNGDWTPPPPDCPVTGWHLGDFISARLDEDEAAMAAMFKARPPDWYDAPLPRRLHRCRPASSGNVSATFVERCACGAIRLNRGPWDERNSRRRS